MLGAPAFPDDPTTAASGRTHLLGRPFKWAAVLVHLPLIRDPGNWLSTV